MILKCLRRIYIVLAYTLLVWNCQMINEFYVLFFFDGAVHRPRTTGFSHSLAFLSAFLRGRSVLPEIEALKLNYKSAI